MNRYLYLSLTPEALIASMLPPEEFGNYLAVGSRKRTRGQALFFEVDPNFDSPFFRMDLIEKKCVPHEDGKPKRSVYLAIYRVLENIPPDKLKGLYLVTDDGRTLELHKSEYNENSRDNILHLYQQLGPVTPRIASSLSPLDFMKFVTDRDQPVSVPRLVFTELVLDELASDPAGGNVNNLPYSNIDHLRDCLLRLQREKDKPTKTVIRFFRGELLYRLCKNGFFIGDSESIFYYPMPSKEELEGKYYTWWRSALTLAFR